MLAAANVMGAAFSARYPVPQDPWTINTRWVGGGVGDNCSNSRWRGLGYEVGDSALPWEAITVAQEWRENSCAQQTSLPPPSERLPSPSPAGPTLDVYVGVWICIQGVPVWLATAHCHTPCHTRELAMEACMQAAQYQWWYEIR
jgi:hypothetical protein